MSQAAIDRQIRPIYGEQPSVHPPSHPQGLTNTHPLHKDALDANANKSAIQQCNKVLKKYPDNELAKVWAVYHDLMMVGWAYVFLDCAL